MDVKKFSIGLLVAGIVLGTSCYGGDTSSFNADWRFSKGECKGAEVSSFNDSSWQELRLPHDWAISGPVMPEGKAELGKLPWQDQGWYRKHFNVDAALKGKRIYFIFDGVMAHPKVYVNGKLVGEWDNGYNSFYLDATDAVKFGADNVMAVYADTREHGSRWYPGAGIYRKVSMMIVDPVHVAIWGQQITTPNVTDQQASVRVRTTLLNESEIAESIVLKTDLLNPKGKVVASQTKSQIVKSGSEIIFDQSFSVDKPVRWDINNPALYTTRTQVAKGGVVCDEFSDTFGIRTFKFTADDGFWLNGRRVALKGVNLHHDHGPIGSVFLPRAMERQLQIMKDMGVTAIRTSHNVSAPELVELCDKMGLVVLNEAFDKWGDREHYKENADHPKDESLADFADRHMQNFVVRDRNHPSVVMWSVGNEIPPIELNQEDNARGKLKMMVDLMKKYDPTRPVTFVTFIAKSTANKHYELYDVHAWNYGGKYILAHNAEPTKASFCAESASAISTRGYYEVPPVRKKTYSNTNTMQMCSYDLQAVGWGDIPDWEFHRLELFPYASGEFVWTGFDYIGEPTPYNSSLLNKKRGGLPKSALSRSSYFGIVDLCGFPKDRFFLYRSYWNQEDTTVHILPHWNWPEHTGKPVPVMVYTSGDSAELFLNGKSLGKRVKSTKKHGLPVTQGQDEYEKQGLKDFNTDYYSILGNYRLIWEDVIYQPGELTAVAYKNGKKIGKAEVKTAAAPYQIRLTADRTSLKASGDDLCYVTVEAYDKKGNLCPLAMNEVKFAVSGPASIAGVHNGNANSHDEFVVDHCTLFYGKAMLVLRTVNGGKGTIAISASSSGLKSDSIKVKAK